MAKLSAKSYRRLATTASRCSPTRDADFLHEAWIETRGDDTRSLLWRAKRRALDERRRQKRQSVEYYRSRSEWRNSPDPIHEVLRNETRAIVRQAVESLPAAQAKVVRLRFWQDLSPKEIARRLRIPLPTVYSRLRLANAKLMAKLQRYLASKEAANEN